MKTRARRFVLVVVCLVACLASPLAGQGSPEFVLVSVPVGARLADTPFPVYAHLTAADGSEYALTFVGDAELPAAHRTRILARSTANPRDFVVALERRPGARKKAREIVEVLLDDGRHVVARATEAQAEALAHAGLDVERLREQPMSLSTPAAGVLSTSAYDPNVAAMVAAVTRTAVTDSTAQLSGVQPVTVEGAQYSITTRHTGSGTPIQKATQYAHERLAASGLSTSFQEWAHRGSSTTTTGRNVIGELRGKVRPSEIVIVCGHLDDLPASGGAPGADDNASGSTATLVAAEVLSSRRFERTIRFALFTGEEQGIFGSAAYADLLKGQGANVVAVLNLDMVAWSSKGSPAVRLHTRTSSSPGYEQDQAIATIFKASVTDYLSGAFSAIATADGETASDHSSFWYQGWPAILAIEDDVSDFNPNYHKVDDTLASLNLSYYTNFVKASVATAALLAVPMAVEPGPELLLSGGRVGVSCTFRDPYTGAGGSAIPIPQNDNFGYFTYQDRANPEVFAKVLDFGAELPYLVFFGGLTNFQVSVTYRVIGTGQTLTLTKDPYNFNGGGDSVTLRH